MGNTRTITQTWVVTCAHVYIPPVMGQAIEGDLMSFGERLRKIRTEQGLTVKELSEASKVPEKNIYRVETGEVEDPRLSTILPLISALNCSADELMFDEQEFTKLGRLRQLFLEFPEFRDEHKDLLLKVIQRINLAYDLENSIRKQQGLPENFELQTSYPREK